jgi:phosphoglycolate phosphatase-like HAD superfamily hydrolase
MHPHPPRWQAVFFDFDGVIAASIEVKVKAFATLFAPYGPTVQEAVIRYHRDNGGMPRQQKLRHCCEVIADKPCDDRELARLGQAFADLVLEEVVAAPLIAGALPTLQQLKESSIPSFIVSGTPHDEMQLIVERKGLQPYFTEVHGSPRPKTAIVGEILASLNYRPEQCLFIGDALADYRAATSNGLQFLGITPKGHASLFPAGVITANRVTLDF